MSGPEGAVWGLASSDEIVRSIVDSSVDGVVVFDEHGTIEVFNTACERLFGYAAVEIVGSYLGILFEPEVARAFARDLRSFLETGEASMIGGGHDVQGVRKDGSRFPLHLSVCEAASPDRRLFTGFIHDLSAYRQALDELEVSRNRLELALSAGEMGVWEWDVRRDVVHWSGSLEQIHGLEPQTFDGTFEAFRRDIVEADRDRVLAAIEAALEQGSTYLVEYRIRRPDGELRWLTARGCVIRDPLGAPARMIGVCADMTARKVAEQRLRERFSQLGAIYRMTEAIARADALSEIYENALEGLTEALAVERAAVALADPDGVMRFKAWRGLSETFRSAVEGHSPWETDETSPAPALVADVELHEPLAPARESLRDEGIRSIAFVPLVARGRLIGKLAVYFDEPRSFGEEAVRLTQAVASTIAFAIDRRRSEEERARLLEQERLAREAAERARSRVARLQSVTSALADAVAVKDVAGILVQEGVSAIGASAGAVFLTVEPVDHEDTLELVMQSGYGSSLVERLARIPASGPSGAARAFRESRPLWYRSAEDYKANHRELADFYATFGYEATAFLPLVSSQERLGVFAVSFVDQRDFGMDEREHLMALAAQCAQALERARLFQREHEIAETLQRNILPRTVPPVEGLAIATSYLPGTGQTHVGGDWYDVIELDPPPRVALVVGDVEGKGIEAAAAMAQLRFALQGFASQGLSPASCLRQLNRLLDRTRAAEFATVVYAELDPSSGTFRYANAGHPPPLVLDRDGNASFLSDGSSLPLGADADTRYVEAGYRLQPGSALVLYTDGLVERRTVDLGSQLDRLGRAAGRPDAAGALRDRILAQFVDPRAREDDIALVVAVRLPGRG